MESKIGIIVCGFDGDRQFITNAYIQSVRYSKGLPVIIPIVRSDRLLGRIYKALRRLSFLRRRGRHPAPVRRNPKALAWRYRYHRRPVSDPLHEADPPDRQTGPCHLPRHADPECGLRRNALAGSLAGARKDPRPYAEDRITVQGGPPRPHRTRKPGPPVLRSAVRGQQFSSSGHKHARGPAFTSAPGRRTARLKPSNLKDTLSPSASNGIPNSCTGHPRNADALPGICEKSVNRDVVKFNFTTSRIKVLSIQRNHFQVVRHIQCAAEILSAFGHISFLSRCGI